MEDWAKRIKDLRDQRGLNNSDLAKACRPAIKPNSVAQWFGEVKDKKPTQNISGPNLVSMAQLLGTTAEYLMTGRTSHVMSIDPETIAHAFVAVEKALRKQGIRYDAAQVPELLTFAYQERLAMEPGRDPKVFAVFDRLIERELTRSIAHGREITRPSTEGRSGEDAQAEAAKKKDRRR